MIGPASVTLALLAGLAAPPTASDRVAVTVDASEAEQVLAILAKRAAGAPVGEADWAALFATEPYLRLRRREAAMGRAFTDDDFRRYVLSDALLARRHDLARTLAAWRTADLGASARRVLAYLPTEATIRARVYPMVKPRPNSFVFELDTAPAVFLFLDPDVPAARFENTVAHELHHIGLGSLGRRAEHALAGLPEGPRLAATWMGAFGEGLAVLAAAGGPDRDPQAHAEPAVRQAWEEGQARFAADVAALEGFFGQVADGRLAGEAVRQRAMEFFGVQGPWYTVGYRMAVLVERRFGREAVVESALDPRRLLARYNQAAADGPGRLPRWSAGLLSRVGLQPDPAAR